MPQWAHLPLILKPDGNGKLSKRDGDRLGFPVFAMNWIDPKNNEQTKGFRELGFLPEAFDNLLAMLGWNDGTAQELFTLEELIAKFSMDRVHKGGAKFDYEKAKWFNHEWIKKLPVEHYQSTVKAYLAEKGLIISDDNYLTRVMTLVKDRCTLLTDFYEQSKFLFETPVQLDLEAVKPKWNADKKAFFDAVIDELQAASSWKAADLEASFKALATQRI
nr:glutamate--tRNA ligase family protein [Paraflavitalea speifideiaquila]